MEEQLQELLGFDTPPIAVTFHDTLPKDIPCVETSSVTTGLEKLIVWKNS